MVIVEQDQVDVGAGGQFAAAELAHAEQRHPATGDAAMAHGEFRLHRIERGAERQVGEV